MSNTNSRTKKTWTRRRFLTTGAASLAGITVVPAHVLGREGKQPPSERLNIAGVGLGVIGTKNLRACAKTENIVAVCDVDWSYAAVGFQYFPKAKKYRDFRRMLDRQKNIDAVVVATPDHTHAVITAEALKRGKHVYTQMPLTYDIEEARTLVRLARKAKVATQMGNDWFSSETIRNVCEWVWSGVLGPVREVHCWTNRPVWPQGLTTLPASRPVPSGLDWDLWLGPAPMRPYSPAYHPYNWRGWIDFGTGALGAAGCFLLAAPYWALKLADAKTVKVEADATGMTKYSYPKASTIRYTFSARANMPPVTLYWYDGGRQPPRPREWPANRRTMGGSGCLFFTDKAKFVFGPVVAGTEDFQAGPHFLPESAVSRFPKPKKIIPRIPIGEKWVVPDRHEKNWIRACKGGPPACCNFEVAGPLTEIVLLGNVALRAGQPVEWDAEANKILNLPSADRFLRRPYRKGWSL